MKKHKSIRVAVTMAATIAASGCSILNKGKGPSTPVLGERISVLSSESGAEVDPAIAGQPLNLPPPVVNADWTQSGGSASKSLGQLALGSAADLFRAGWARQQPVGASRLCADCRQRPCLHDRHDGLGPGVQCVDGCRGLDCSDPLGSRC